MAYQSWGKPFVFTQAITTWTFLWISIEKNVLIEILDLPSIPRHVKKTRKSPHLGYILLPLLDFCCSNFFITCCLLPLYHKDIFQKRNVHECLQCPPHWNTWGKVSSLTLWSIPAPQLEPQRLVAPRMRKFFSRWIFPMKGLLVQLELH